MHNKRLLARLQSMFERAGINPLAVSVVGFACGPGSFTGVRMAASATQAIAVAADCLVAPVTTNDALLLSYHEADSKRAVCAIKSRGDAFYLSTRSQPVALYDMCPDWLSGDEPLLGDMPPWWPSAHDSVVTHSDPLLLVKHAEVQFLSGAAQNPERALPVYFSGDSPWKKKSTSPSGARS